MTHIQRYLRHGMIVFNTGWYVVVLRFTSCLHYKALPLHFASSFHWVTTLLLEVLVNCDGPHSRLMRIKCLFYLTWLHTKLYIVVLIVFGHHLFVTIGRNWVLKFALLPSWQHWPVRQPIRLFNTVCKRYMRRKLVYTEILSLNHR
jgi:hypothetical protein